MLMVSKALRIPRCGGLYPPQSPCFKHKGVSEETRFLLWVQLAWGMPVWQSIQLYAQQWLPFSWWHLSTGQNSLCFHPTFQTRVVGDAESQNLSNLPNTTQAQSQLCSSLHAVTPSAGRDSCLWIRRVAPGWPHPVSLTHSRSVKPFGCAWLKTFPAFPGLPFLEFLKTNWSLESLWVSLPSDPSFHLFLLCYISPGLCSHFLTQITSRHSKNRAVGISKGSGTSGRKGRWPFSLPHLKHGCWPTLSFCTTKLRSYNSEQSCTQ